MVSASHNPADDNGLKVLSGGRKIDDEVEEELERLLFQAESLPGMPNGADRARSRRDPGPIEAYRASLVAEAGDLLRGMRIGIDCANGSAAAIAPDLLRELGASVTVLSASPDGTNINLDSGSTQPQALAAAVLAGGLEMGMAFDGDADRLIAVDERGVDRRRRRGDGDLRPGAAGRRNAAEPDPGHDRDEQRRPRPRHRRRRRAGDPDAGRRSPRLRGDGARRRVAGRRAVRAHHLPRRREHRGRDPDRHPAASNAARHRRHARRGSLPDPDAARRW